ncbi:MAG TPA: peptide chain release factor 3 [Candidatus Paceibacterota bacterium]|nr:peptide chain release factor 3 [Verrucomicrobiota bacterium]HOX01127.1 peptide chain release factor 3 [Verrucomicrobiota bacterium]HRZ44025.1 peptide chain release factor 3 [Candidatus Paceibacterota bacterium]HRZ94370.1 peptide chain release factor 3 [Candidatus Paceibacterota bacterium]
MNLETEIGRRRTFAIISHPDAGKTTLTEKFLLYGGAVQLAGSVTARKNQRATASDWMELEKQRGISISSTVLQFEYRGRVVNLLDTPGHKDFSEDTYRVLTAVDSAVMVIDAGKGIESQTRKLFEVCRHRGIPIFTFMNKLDRPARDPLALLDELERVLGIHAYPVNWPLGDGPAFRGVFDRQSRHAHFFQRVPGGEYRAPVQVHDLADPVVQGAMAHDAYARVVEEIAMLEGAGAAFDRAAILRGALTPVFFGSAVNNFGVQLLLDAFLDLAPAPQPRAVSGRTIDPARDGFSGFIFKIQANMDPKHRDRLAFLRVCSGRFERDMTVIHTRSGRSVRLASSHKLLGRERSTVDEAYPGDVVGLVGHSSFRIGDTLAHDPAIVFDEIPRFAPECFAWIHSSSVAQFKRFREGLDQLLQEGVVQSFLPSNPTQRAPLLGAVGPLQFEVVQYRLLSEYGAESRLETAPWKVVRWIDHGTVLESSLPSGARMAVDAAHHPVILFADEWSCNFFAERHPKTPLRPLPPGAWHQTSQHPDQAMGSSIAH